MIGPGGKLRGSDLIARMRERMPLLAWAVFGFLGASVVFAIWGVIFGLNANEERKGPDPYGEQDLAVLRVDPLMHFATEEVVPRGEPDEEISHYLCAICDFFPTGILQGYELKQEPSVALASVEKAAKSAGWTTVERKCTTDPALAILIVEKNFPEFHTSSLFEVNVGGESAGMRLRASITHKHKRISAEDLGETDCLDEKWRNLPGGPASTGSG
jgi:hypothetical protein